MSKPLKCANAYPRMDNKPATCASNAAGLSISVSMATDVGGEPMGSRNEAFAVFCRACATKIYNDVIEAAQAQAKGSL